MCVFEVPSDIPAYDENMIHAGSVNDGEIFENYRDFPFVGTLVKRVTLTATYDDETYLGLSDSDDNDARLGIAADDLARELPAGEDGDEVEVKDEDGDVVGTLTFEERYGRWAFAA
ncbi:hypothetical protein [Aureimonas sp. Leaf324]|uniref:hypothetical protein n=1 Tax=Aureimonas sp. Leaf324 TaxID=1736336 RepID=UPI000700840B|nr:hypothetical protein [Aureimonas sp. Leaf324]KQQ90972.1 hypothetical protein ASF65_00055 [Aureimonas sp. Leaf324]